MVKDNKTKTLFYISDYLQENGYPPTLSEIKSFLGLKSNRGAELQLKKLESEGYISKQSYVSRGIKLLFLPSENDGQLVKLPVIGEIKAGIPNFAEENIIEYIEVDKSKLRGRTDAFILKVRGDSMIGKGIYPGDMAIIEPTTTAHDGDIVVALLPQEGTATLKIFKRLENYIALLPANPKYQPIIATDVLIQGKYLGLIRN